MRRLFVALVVCAALAPARAFAGENFVYVRTNPIAFAVHGTPMFPTPGGGASGWYPDLFGIGFNYGKLDFGLNMTAQNAFPGRDEFSVLYGRASVGIRPLKKGQVATVDPYAYAGLGFGGAGNYQNQESTCVSTPAAECPMHRAGWGGGVHGGVGIDFNIPLFTIQSSQQRVSLFFGLDARAELFIRSGAHLFTVYSVPVGLRLD